MTSKLTAYRVNVLAGGVVVAERSDGAVCVSDDYRKILKFLIGESGWGMRVVWSVSELLDAIKVLLPDLVLEKAGPGYRATWEDDTRYRLFHLPGKLLGIHAGGFGAESDIYELDQFYPDDPPHDTIAETQVLADNLVAEFASLGVEHITNLKSPVAVIESAGLLDKYYKGIPNNSSIPDSAVGILEYAIDCDIRGGWVSAYQVGCWTEGLHIYDLTSAYPSIAARLLPLDGGKYQYSRDMLNGAVYGFLKGTMHIDPDSRYAFCSPIQAVIGDELVANAVGRFPGVFTLSEVRFVEQSGIGRFDMKDGWFISNPRGEHPMQAVMTDLFRQRMASSPLRSQLLKRIIDGIIGRLGEYRDNQPTEHTNAVYHALIRTEASLMVGRFLIENEVSPSELVHVHTDGCRLTRYIQLSNGGKQLGKWRYEGREPTIVLSPTRVLHGAGYDRLVSDIKNRPDSVDYSGLNLGALMAEQDRDFEEYPVTGRELVEYRYTSVPLVAGGKWCIR